MPAQLLDHVGQPTVFHFLVLDDCYKRWDVTKLTSEYLTIIPRARVGYEMIDSSASLASMMSHPKGASRIIVSLKTSKK